MSHTPAPWYDTGFRIHGSGPGSGTSDGPVIVDYKHNPEFNYDDAPLIVAAPKLLEAVRLAARELMRCGRDEIVDELVGAIAAATGAKTWSSLVDRRALEKLRIERPDDVAAIAAAVPELHLLSPFEVHALWRTYSDDVWSAGWIMPSGTADGETPMLSHFREWLLR